MFPTCNHRVANGSRCLVDSLPSTLPKRVEFCVMMLSQFTQFRMMRWRSEQLRHTNARYGGAGQRGTASLSQLAR
eukprot:1508538-Pleurochrysis_carterae.AAC.1